MGFLIDWCGTGGVAERDGTTLRTITAAGSRITSCRTSASWDYSMSTWRWVSYFNQLAYNTEVIAVRLSKINASTKYKFMVYKSQILYWDNSCLLFIPVLHFPHFSPLSFFLTNSVRLLCCFSDPVWFHHFVCGLFPLGSPPGSFQQHPGDQGGRLEVHHPVQTTSGIQGPKHWSVAGNPQRSGHFVCCYQCGCYMYSSVWVCLSVTSSECFA